MSLRFEPAPNHIETETGGSHAPLHTVTGLTALVTNTIHIYFNSCHDANNNNNYLLGAYYYESLVNNEKKISEEKKKDMFEENCCRQNLLPWWINKKFLVNLEGFMKRPEFEYGYPIKCGCVEVKQSDYWGRNVVVTKSGRECQCCDSQSK